MPKHQKKWVRTPNTASKHRTWYQNTESRIKTPNVRTNARVNTCSLSLHLHFTSLHLHFTSPRARWIYFPLKLWLHRTKIYIIVVRDLLSYISIVIHDVSRQVEVYLAIQSRKKPHTQQSISFQVKGDATFEDLKGHTDFLFVFQELTNLTPNRICLVDTAGNNIPSVQPWNQVLADHYNDYENPYTVTRYGYIKEELNMVGPGAAATGAKTQSAEEKTHSCQTRRWLFLL